MDSNVVSAWFKQNGQCYIFFEKMSRDFLKSMQLRQAYMQDKHAAKLFNENESEAKYKTCSNSQHWPFSVNIDICGLGKFY